MPVPLCGWLAVPGAIVVMLAVDLLAHRRAHVIAVREAAARSLVWVAGGAAFGGLVWAVYGSIAAILGDHDDLEVVAQAANGDEALARVAEHEPDVVLMDLRMPGADGIEATRRLVASGSATKVLVLTTFDGDEDVVAALRAGAQGFLLKDSPRSRLVDAVRAVVEGELVLAPSVARRLVQEFTEQRVPRRPDPRVERLSAREREVLLLAGSGLSNAEIASRLWLAEATVKTHLARALAKLDLRDRVAAVVYCHRTGLLP